MAFSAVRRAGAPSMEHPARSQPMSTNRPRYDEGAQYDIIRDSVTAGEQIYGVFASESAGVAMVGVTNKRIIILDTAFTGGRAALVTAPFSRITTVSYISTDDEPIFSRTLAIQVGRIFYEVTCRGEEQAAELHDIVSWHLMN